MKCQHINCDREASCYPRVSFWPLVMPPSHRSDKNCGTMELTPLASCDQCREESKAMTIDDVMPHSAYRQLTETVVHGGGPIPDRGSMELSWETIQ